MNADDCAVVVINTRSLLHPESGDGGVTCVAMGVTSQMVVNTTVSTPYGLSFHMCNLMQLSAKYELVHPTLGPYSGNHKTT